VSVLGAVGGRMAAGGRSVACYAAALLATAVLLSAPATTGPALPFSLSRSCFCAASPWARWLDPCPANRQLGRMARGRTAAVLLPLRDVLAFWDNVNPGWLVRSVSVAPVQCRRLLIFIPLDSNSA
jgi:hypothetical protein